MRSCLSELRPADSDPAAIAAVYILLGVLKQSYIHPITILSTLPASRRRRPAGADALSHRVRHHWFDRGDLIDRHRQKERDPNDRFCHRSKTVAPLNSSDAIYEACLLRFRPIIMTTTAAILGAVPLALSFGQGVELRRPLGLSIIGGLLVSQLLTCTPPILSMEQLGQWSFPQRWRRFRGSV